MHIHLKFPRPPIVVHIFLLFAVIEVIQSIAESYFGFDHSIADLQKSLGSYLPDFLQPILYTLYVSMNTIFDATQMYFIVLLRNNPMRLFYLLSNCFVFFGFFTEPSKIMNAFHSANSQEIIMGSIALVALICAMVTSICLTNKNFLHWMKHQQDHNI